MSAIIKHDRNHIEAAGASINVGYAEMAAVVAVEARGTGFVGGRLQILYEPHVAWRELTRQKSKDAKALRDQLARAGLAYAKWGAHSYPETVAARHDQLARAVKIAGTRAYRWISMGMPQIMGFNAKTAGYPDAKAMFDTFIEKGEPEQLLAMARFIGANKAMASALRNNDWAGFARRYNGKGYKKNRYHTKLATAFARAKRHQPPANAWADDLLGIGDKGDDVRALQEGLHRRGFNAGVIDGDFGPMTAQAVRAWQLTQDRDATGQLDIAAFAAIKASPNNVPKPNAAAAPDAPGPVPDDFEAPAARQPDEPDVRAEAEAGERHGIPWAAIAKVAGGVALIGLYFLAQALDGVRFL